MSLICPLPLTVPKLVTFTPKFCKEEAPLASLALTLKLSVLVDPESVGVPDINPVEGLIEAHKGSESN